MIYISIWLIFALIGAGIGHRKKKVFTGFLAGFFLGPIGLILMMLSKPKFMCPECGGSVEKDFSKCKQCGSSIKDKIIQPDAPIPCSHCGELNQNVGEKCWNCGEFNIA